MSFGVCLWGLLPTRVWLSNKTQNQRPMPHNKQSGTLSDPLYSHSCIHAFWRACSVLNAQLSEGIAVVQTDLFNLLQLLFGFMSPCTLVPCTMSSSAELNCCMSPSLPAGYVKNVVGIASIRYQPGMATTHCTLCLLVVTGCASSAEVVPPLLETLHLLPLATLAWRSTKQTSSQSPSSGIRKHAVLNLSNAGPHVPSPSGNELSFRTSGRG